MTRLPAAYELATQALAICSRIDECKDWADKAQALASYAKQARDDQLRKMADRIQARAIRRCGELLKQIPDGKGRNQFTEDQDGTVPTRTEAADSAGLSERQRKTAIRVASVPEEEFEQQVESATQPGKQPRPLVDLGSIPPADYTRATEAQGALRRFAEFYQGNEPARIAAAFQDHEIESLRGYVGIVS